MFFRVGGSMLIFAALATDAAIGLRVRSLDGVADDWPLDYAELLPYYERSDRDFGVSGMGGDPAYTARRRGSAPAAPSAGRGGLKVARAHSRLGWHWWPEPNSILSVAYDGRHPCVQRGTCQQGCGEGAKASTDLTHWPKAIAAGARLVTGARVRRLETNAKGLVTGATWLDEAGAEHFESARSSSWPRTRSAPRGCCCVRLRHHPDGLANSSGMVGKRLMMHPSPTSAVVRRGPRELAGPVRLLDRVVRFYETDERRGFVRGPMGASRPRSGPSTRRCRPGPGRRTGARTTTSTSARTWAGAPTGACSARTSPTRPTRSGCRRRSRTRPGSRRRRSTTRCPITRAGCLTSTSRRRPNRCARPAPTRSRWTA